jgi:HPt (histidine-containing phosphotransfer) domain-containing protein
MQTFRSGLNVDEELDELKREFLAEAEEKVREIEATLGTRTDAGSLERLAYLAHQLKGSGGSYGYQKISTDAAEIEKAVESLTEGGVAEPLHATMETHVASLRSEIEKRIRELSATAR